MKKLLPLYLLIAFAGLFPTAAPADELTRGLVAWYRFEGNLTDASGNGNHATLGAGAETYAAGQYGQAWDNNTTRWLNSNVSISSTDTDFTVSVWARIDGAGTYIAAQTRTDSPYTSDWIIGLTTPFWFRAVTLGPPMSTYNDGNFHHFVLVWHRNSAFYEGYVNGVRLGQQNVSGFGGTGQFRIGTRGDGTSAFWAGQIDNLKIYNRALAPHEIRALYALGSPIGAAP